VNLVGHDSQIAAFVAAAHGGRPHHAWLLTGPRGIGKASFARQAARRLLAEATPLPPYGSSLAVPPDHPTARLFAAGSHPDFRILERLTNEKTGTLARNISVDQVRSLRALFATAPSMGDRRVVIIDAADDMERGAANALLKNLEEPPASTIFFLVSHAPGRLLPTIRSRCRVLPFRALDDAAMDAVVGLELPSLDEPRRKQLIAAANGIPATALAMAGLDMAAIEQALIAVAETGDPTNGLRSALAQSLALKAALPRYEAFLQRTPRFIAAQARLSSGAALERALDAWTETEALSRSAIPQSLVPETVVLQMMRHVAALAPANGSAKA
jgi:DNA polymerase III subunit delta'